MISFRHTRKEGGKRDPTSACRTLEIRENLHLRNTSSHLRALLDGSFLYMPVYRYDLPAWFIVTGIARAVIFIFSDL